MVRGSSTPIQAANMGGNPTPSGTCLPSRRLGGRRPHAHRASRERAQGGPGRPRGAAWGDLPRRPRSAIHVEGPRSALCGQLGVTQSLGGVGSSADNALAESFNAALKRETLAGATTYSDAASCRREIFRWATRYNTRRRHSYLGHQAPNTYETKLADTLPEAAYQTHPVSTVRGQGSSVDRA